MNWLAVLFYIPRQEIESKRMAKNPLISFFFKAIPALSSAALQCLFIFIPNISTSFIPQLADIPPPILILSYFLFLLTTGPMITG